MRSIVIKSPEQWIQFLENLNESGATFVAASDLDNGAPTTYPVLAKLAMTTVYAEDDEPVPAYIVMLVTQAEAAEFLETERLGLESYTYAEAL